MTALETKILEALKDRNQQMEEYDAKRQAEHDKYMKEAAIQTSEFWKEDKERSAEWVLQFQHHGYDFTTSWMNVISQVMYGRVYHEWHSAQAGKYKGTGHGAYITSELTKEEKEKINLVFNGLVKQGYLRLSKSGAKAKLVKC